MITTGTLFPHSERTVILASAGAGKGLPVTSKILTKKGFIQLKDLQLYDKVISPVDGKEYPVTGIYNRGYRHVNKATFTNGTSVLFDDDHLWAIQSDADRCAGKPFTVVSAEELKNTPLHRQAGKWRKHLVFIPVSCPVEFSDKDLPMPYALGLFISDGSTVARNIVIAEEDVKRKFEDDIKECGGYLKPLKKKYNYYLYNFRSFKNKFSFFGTHSYNKFIPKEYLYASLETRRKLLAGLIDGDGTVYSSGKIDFDSTSAQLIEDITFLVSSLGGVVTKRNGKTGKYKKDGNTIMCRSVYRITFWLPEGVVLSEKHMRRLDFCANQRHQYKAIESIEDAGYEDCMCIYIDSPDHLFITDDWIVTHNTSRLMDILGEQLVTTDSSRIAFVTFTRKGVSEGVSRVLKKYPFLSYEQLPFFRTLHSLCFRELKLDRNRLWGIQHEKLLNASIGSNVHRFYDIDHATKDNQILDAYDIERSGGRADPNIVCTPEYERLTKAYDEVKKQTGAIDFTDCLQLFVEQGKSLPVDIACIDECFSPETEVRMADGSTKEIRHIKVGDKVQGTRGATTVIAKQEGVDDMYNVVSPENTVLFTCNSRHALVSPVTGTWEEARKLETTRVSFKRFYSCFQVPVLCRVHHTKKAAYVGITVDALDSLFVLANGCVVHNCQDLTDLQWDVCNVAFANAKKVYCAGDDYQCVFSYAGANPQVLIDLAKVSRTEKLEVSHRLPTSVYKLAKKITDNIEVKIDKDYRPKNSAKKGNIKFLPDLLSLYPFLKNQAEGDWYILTRNTAFQKDVIVLLEGLLLPYVANDRYFIPAKDWAKIKDFWMFRKEGYKTEEKRDEFLKQYSIKNIFGSMVETQLFNPIKSTLYQAYLDLYGFDKLEEWYTKKKGIVVSNIHRVKGGEAQNVAIIMDCGKKVAEHAFEVPDDELRTLYVAVTRTKENLFFIRSDSNDALDALLWKCINSGE